MKSIIKILFIFLAITGATTILFNFTDIKFGAVDYFTKHGWFFLVFVTIFPRLTLLVSGIIFNSIEFGALLWWLGFFFTPRILVAVLATTAYWNTNQILVIISWLIAMGGESSEKIFINRKIRPSHSQKFSDYNGTTVDAEYKVKE